MCRVFLPRIKNITGKIFQSVVCAHCVVLLVLSLEHSQAAAVSEAENDDYDLEGEEIVTEIPCTEPDQIANGETQVWGEGLLLEYRCKPGYFAVGITHGACDLSKGTWTIDPPVCADNGCPELTPPTHGVVNIDNSGGLATIHCRPGYFLIGDATLICEEGRWQGVFPTCAVTVKLNQKTKSRKETESKKTTMPMGSGPDFSLEESDESCLYNQILPPEIEYAVVDTGYEFNEIRHRYVMVASYTCMGGFKLRSETSRQMFCKNNLWNAPIMPQCIPEDDPCEINNGDCHHYCTPQGSHRHACSCYDGYNLASDAKTCKDADECAIDNGGCEQECFNTDGSFFCSCTLGFIPKGPNCIDTGKQDLLTFQ